MFVPFWTMSFADRCNETDTAEQLSLVALTFPPQKYPEVNFPSSSCLQ